MFRRILILIMARNREYYRDKSALGWNFLFPFLVIAGFSLMFNENGKPLVKVGVVGPETPASGFSETYTRFRETRYAEFLILPDMETARNRIAHHKVDLIVVPANGTYIGSASSPKSYLAEKLLQAAAAGPEALTAVRQEISREEIPYVAWLFPGIIAMNMMFSSLYGVGYVVVRYRKNGVLKRLSVTPLKAHEFLIAQVVSRLIILLVSSSIVYFGCSWLYGFSCEGSFFDLFLVAASGGFALISMGLIVASRGTSEELAEGLLNLITWPMMFLSEVWFSIEGAHPWVHRVADLLPLTHLLKAARRIINDGAVFSDVSGDILFMTLMSVVFLVIGSLLFQWRQE